MTTDKVRLVLSADKTTVFIQKEAVSLRLDGDLKCEVTAAN